ncbi:MAG: DegV family protein [SAR202 cluster bacterium]|nr:DegV family protein [SAR202 cluster bacterium]|tara:strand:+ start:513 stop:1379 length:867 start_codon:yes stop_codon:yes gene_type:complete
MSNQYRKMAIVTDSAAAITAELAQNIQLHVARMEITIDGVTFVDDGNPVLDGFYERLKVSQINVTTSAPKPGEYLEKFRIAAENADDLLCITVSGRLSASYDSASVAAKIFKERNVDKTVHVFDSQLAASSQALVVTEAVRLASNGLAICDVKKSIRCVSKKVRLVAMLDTLKYIHKSGRVPKMAVWAAGLLNIKPVMEFSIDRIGAIARPRSTDRALNLIRQEMQKDLKGRLAHVNIIHAGAPDKAAGLREWVLRNLETTELFVTQFHPFMGAHTGPGLVGASWWVE